MGHKDDSFLEELDSPGESYLRDHLDITRSGTGTVEGDIEGFFKAPQSVFEPMKIALDYDGTFTRDPGFWRGVALAAKDQGHDVRIVTWREQTRDNIDDRVGDIPVIYCNGIAKRYYCHHFADFDPHVWIDDKPEAILGNTAINRDGLANWRATRDH